MSIIAWLVLGLVAGFLGSRIVNKRGVGVLGDVVLGIVGAFVGGALFTFLGGAGVTGLNLWSLVVAVTGSVVLLIAYHTLRRVTA